MCDVKFASSHSNGYLCGNHACCLPSLSFTISPSQFVLDSIIGRHSVRLITRFHDVVGHTCLDRCVAQTNDPAFRPLSPSVLKVELTGVLLNRRSGLDPLRLARRSS